ncbi:MAG: DUF4861 family protein [Bacteroidota bacterium]
MKKQLAKLLSYLILFLLISNFISCQDEVGSFTVTNKSNILRIQETVSIDLIKYNYFSNLSVTNHKGEIIVSQLVDNDGDDKPDEILFQDDFKAQEVKTYHLVKTENQIEDQSKVYAAFIKGREDLAWESDKIAFRMYGPPLANEVNNGIDVWAKRVDYLIVNKWYKEEAEGKSYHVDTGEGADFFSVGKSLGAGGSALYRNNSLYQSGVYKKYQIITNGPIRTKFKLSYSFEIDGSKILEEKIVSIDVGSYLNRIETTYNKIPNDIVFVAGLVKRESTNIFKDSSNSFISLWGNISSNDNDGELGTAVILPDAKMLTINEDNTHVLISKAIDESKKIVYYSGAGWSKQRDFKTEDDWIIYLNDFYQKLNNPLIIDFK